MIKTIHYFFLLIGLSLSGISQNLERDLDHFLTAKYPANIPGATVLVAKDGVPIYRKAFGMANLELDVPMVPENVFEIGSITKQFTAVAMLMLEEQGKVALTDKLSKYIADYPKGDQITIAQLLNHTSGIKSYTSMPSFQSLARTDMSPLELINTFKEEPFDFEPGTQFLYNNSAYIIAGYIIEEASGMSYEDFIEENIFQKLGMSQSRYGSHTELVMNRAYGYQPDGNDWRNADYLSLTLPYAAGSLMSTIDDLLIWHEAIRNNALITEASKMKAFTPGTTTDGTSIHYGYGWFVNEIQGTPSIEHGGGIFGYTTMGIYLPEEHISVYILTNKTGESPTDTAIQVAAIALGNPYKAPNASVPENEMKQWIGTYEFEDGTLRNVTFENGQLMSQRENSEKLPLYPASATSYYFEDGMVQYLFKNNKGTTEVVFKNRGIETRGKITDKKLTDTSTAEAISLAVATLNEYIGDYELQPGFVISVTVKDEQLYAQATGQPQFPLFASAKDKFFLKVVNATVDFLRTDGAVSSLVLHQGGRDLPGKKID